MTMPRLRWIVPVLLLVGAVPASGVVGGSELSKPGVIRITNREASRTVVDQGVPGRSAGDLLITTQILYNRRHPGALGHQEILARIWGEAESSAEAHARAL